MQARKSFLPPKKKGPPMYLSPLGEILVEARVRRKLTSREALKNKMKQEGVVISTATIRDYETGKVQRYNPEVIDKFCRFLDLNREACWRAVAASHASVNPNWSPASARPGREAQAKTRQ